MAFSTDKNNFNDAEFFSVVIEEGRKEVLRKVMEEKFQHSSSARSLLFDLAVDRFRNSKKTIVAFEFFPKDIPTHEVGDEGINVNRQRHILATSYLSKKDMIDEVEKAKRFLKNPFSDMNNKRWDHATYHHNNWFSKYNTFKDNEHVIGFTVLKIHGQNDKIDFVRPNDIVVNTRTGEFFHYNKDVYALKDGQLELKVDKKIHLEFAL